MLALGKGDSPLFVIRDQCTPVKNALGWESVFCACEIGLLSVVFCVVRAVPKLDFRIVINKTLRHGYKQNITSYGYKQNITSYSYKQNITS